MILFIETEKGSFEAELISNGNLKLINEITTKDGAKAEMSNFTELFNAASLVLHGERKETALEVDVTNSQYVVISKENSSLMKLGSFQEVRDYFDNSAWKDFLGVFFAVGFVEVESGNI